MQVLADQTNQWYFVLQSLFHTIFGKYGLVYGVQVFPVKWQLDEKKTGNHSGGYYGFVTFYSSLSAARSKDDLNNKVVIEGNECKISFAKRKKKVQESTILHFTRCRELANYYLGFNGWSSQIKLLYEEAGQADSANDTPSVKYVCVVRLDFPHQKLHTDGMGAWQESYIKQDPVSRGRAVCKCKKLAFQRALENSFSRVLLIILSNGKVTVEIDTTKPDILPQELQEEEAVIKVNNLDEDPGLDGEKDVEVESIAVTMEDLDLNNLDILQQLEVDI
ncbi:hypothetical protein ACJMK2_030389 [Sinanodonta woodiana]|uniref:DM1 domain-containing protein n=1 Tax=Sinanodonta woodiana TaxID=1069815 RepID=A0ABD3XD15_SINWO